MHEVGVKWRATKIWSLITRGQPLNIKGGRVNIFCVFINFLFMKAVNTTVYVDILEPQFWFWNKNNHTNSGQVHDVNYGRRWQEILWRLYKSIAIMEPPHLQWYGRINYTQKFAQLHLNMLSKWLLLCLYEVVQTSACSVCFYIFMNVVTP